MPFIGGAAYELTVRGLLQGKICENKFDYSFEVGDPLQPGFMVADMFADLVIPEWVPLVTSDYQFLEIEYWSAFSQGSGVYPLPATVGSYAGNTLPSYVTAWFTKVPELPVNQEGTDTEPIKRGGFGMSGIGENLGDNGIITDGAWLTQAAALGQALLILPNINGSAADAHLTIKRPAPGGNLFAPLKIAEVTAIQAAKFGSQNGRKR